MKSLEECLGETDAALSESVLTQTLEGCLGDRLAQGVGCLARVGALVLGSRILDVDRHEAEVVGLYEPAPCGMDVFSRIIENSSPTQLPKMY